MRKPLFSLLVTLILLLASSMGINAQTDSDTLLFEDFNGTTLPSGWDTCRWIPGTSTTTSLATYRWKSNTGGVSSSRCAYLQTGTNTYTYTSQHGLMTLAKQFNSTDRYKLCFDLKNYTPTTSTSYPLDGDMNVLVTLDNGATISDTIKLGINTGKDWVHYELGIPASTMGESNVRFLFLGKSNHYYYLDNVVICKASTCKPAADISAQNLSETGITLNWSIGTSIFDDASIPSSFDVTVYKKSDGTPVFNQNVSGFTLTLTGLAANTEYVAEVKSSCSTVLKGDAATFEFKTYASAVALPYTIDFESGIPQECYTSGATAVSDAHSSSGSLKLTTTATAGAKFLTPRFGVSANAAEVSLWIKPSAAGIVIQLGYATNPYDDGEFTEVGQYTTGAANIWQEIRFNAAGTAHTANLIMYGIVIAAGSSFNVNIDDVNVHQQPTCMRPESLTLTDVQANQVTLDWSMANATDVLVYATSSTDTVTALAQQHPFTMTGLNEQTNYQFTVRGICSATDSSDISNPVTVKTPCGVAASTLFFEGAETTSGTAIPTCWTTGHIHKTALQTGDPFYTVNTTMKGTRGFALRDMTTGNIAYLCSQALNFDSLGKYSFRYEYYRPSGSTAANNGEGLKVFVTPTLGDTTNAVEVIPFVNRQAGLSPVTTTIGWNTYEGVINYQGTGYIMIVGYSLFKAASYFDNLEVFLTPQCPKVTDITTGNVTTTTYDIAWTAGGDETQWVATYLVKHGNDTVKFASEILNAAQLSVPNLTPATSYTITGVIRALCGAGDTAEAVSFSRSFTTACLALNSLPYTNDFESDATGSSAAFVTCWTRFNDATGTVNYYPYNYNSTANSHSGNNVLHFYTTTSNTYAAHQMAILPEVDTTVYPINTLRLKFWAKRSSTSSYADAPMIIGVMSDPADLTTFVPVDTVLVSNTAHQEFITRLDSYTGNGKYIAIRLDRQASICYCYLDDVTLEEIPNCMDINGSATVSDNDTTSVKVTLADQTATSAWSYAYGPAGTAVAEMTAVDTTGAFIILSGLTSATNYDLYVRRNCGNGNYSPWSSKVSFATIAVPATAPYICGFEDAAENANWMIVPGASATNQFAVGAATTHSGLQSIYVSNDNGTTNAYTIASCATRTYAYRTVHFDAKGYQIDLDWRCAGGQGAPTATTIYDYARIMLYPVNEPIPAGASFTNITSTDRQAGFPATAINLMNTDSADCIRLAGNDWHHISKFVNMTAAPGNYNLVFAWNNNAATGTADGPLAVDDISITELSCIPPVTIATSLTDTSVTLTVSQTTASQWEFIVDTIAFTKFDAPAAPLARISSTTGTATVTGLTPNREYWYSVRTICGVGDTSAWLDVTSLRTYCSAYSTPYTEGFETVDAALCWSAMDDVTSQASVVRATDKKKSGLASLKSVKATVISPEFAVDSLTHYMISGYALATTDSVQIKIGVIVNPSDPDTYEPLTTVNIPVKNDWNEFTAYFTGLLDPDRVLFKGAKHIAIQCLGDNTVYFDDINVELAPTCPKPNEVNISNVTANSFDITFTDHASASQWVVYTNGTPHLLTSTTATISGLDAHTAYAVGLAAICSATDTSAIADCGNVTTECDVMSLPYTESFETLPTTYTQGMISALCWSELNTNTTASAPYYKGNANTPSDGARNLWLNSKSTQQPMYLIFPQLASTTNALKVSFDVKFENATYSGNVYFGYMTDVTADSSFVLLETASRSLGTAAWTTKNVVVPSIPSGARFAFKYADVLSTTMYYAYIDNLKVTEIRNCSDPETPTISNVTAAAADVAFSDTAAAHTAWEYVYGPTGFNPNNAVPVSIDTTVFTISGLNDDTNYDVYVRAVCGVGDESNYVKASFRTLCVPFVVTETTPFSDSFEDLASSEVLAGCYTVDGHYSTSYTMKGATRNTATFTYSHTGDQCLYSYQSYTYVKNGQTAYRQFHLTGGKTYKASVWVRATTYSNNFAGILFGTQANADSMTVVASINPTSCAAVSSNFSHCWEEISGYITAPATGDYFIALRADRGESTNTTINIYFDDFTVQELQGCLPTNVDVDSVTTNTVFAHYADTAAAHVYEYMVMNGTDTLVAPTVATVNPFTVSGLPHSSLLTLYLRQTCEGGNVSEWSTADFRTECGAMDNLPYTIDFEDEATGTSVPFISCWNRFNDASSTYNYYPYVNTASTYAHSGTKVMYFYSSTTTTYAEHQMAVLPEVDTALYPINTLRLKFWAQRSTTSTYADAPMIIGVMTDPANLSTFVPVETVLVSNTTMQQFKVSLARYSGNGKYIAIRLDRQPSTCYCYMDDITLEEIPACEGPEVAPTFISSTMTTLTVRADMAGKDTIEFGIVPGTGVISPASIDTTIISVDGNACFTGLTGSTNYAVWYRYYCGVHGVSAWSLAYAVGATTASDCFAPQNLHTVGMINNHHAEITWGKAPDAVAYEYELRTATALVDSVVAPVATLGDTIVYDSLATNTQYTFRARTLCATDTSAWQTINFHTTYPTYQLPFVCGFENAAQNAGWQFRTLSSTATNQLTIGSGVSLTGSNALYVSDNGSTYQYTISSASVSDAEILLEIPAGNYAVSYDWQGYGESSYDFGRFFLLPATVTLPTGATYSSYSSSLPTGAISLEPNKAKLNLKNDWTNHSAIVNVPNTNVYKLVALWANDASSGTQPPFAIDNISIEKVSCMPVNSVSMVTVNSTDAKAVVNPYDSAVVEYALSVYNAEDSLSWNVAAGDTLSFTQLVPNTTYYLFARHSCDTASKSTAKMVSFHTPAIPVQLPFVTSFEANDTLNSHWTMTSGTSLNWFIIGSANSSRGSRSLYITDDGSSNHYHSQTSTTNYAYAYIPILFNAGIFDVSYNWICHGEGAVDYGHVFLAPATMIPQDDVIMTGMSGSAVPTGTISLDGSNAKLNMVNAADSTDFNWRSVATEVQIANAGTYNLIVAWRNDFSVNHQPPLAIDNIVIREQTCKSVTGVNYSATTTTATLKAVHANDSTAKIFWHVASDNTYSDTVAMAVTDSVLSLTGLNPASRYYFKVAVVCNGNDTSNIKSYFFRTVCDTIRQFPYFEGFEDYAAGLADSTWRKDACWNVVKNATAAYSYPTNTASSIHSGNRSLYVYNNATTTQQYLAMPMMQNLNGKTISFWHKAGSTTATNNTLSFGYTTTGSDFVNIQTFANKVTDWSEHTQVLSNIPAGARLVFKFEGTSTYYLDDIRINDIVTTPAVYNDTICFNAPYNKHGYNFGAGSLFAGDTTFTSTVISTTPSVADSVITVNIHIRSEIATVAYDTICANTPMYVWGADTIFNPTGTATHNQRFVSQTCGCDSTVSLTLTVLPESVDINRTICQGDSVVVGDTVLYFQGYYMVYYQTAQGCTIAANVNLVVVDSVQVIAAEICEGSSYPFHGQTYTQPGIYRVDTTGAAGCPVILELHLTVYPEDSTIVTTFCRGGSITIAQEVITNDTVFTKVIVNGTSGCTTTYHVTATTDAPIPEHVYANACEGYLFTGYGIVDLYVDHDTVCYVSSRTADGLCDSITAVNIKYNLTAHGSESAVIPASGSYTWHDRTLQTPGTYTDTLKNQSAAGCDSIVTLTLTGGTGFDYAETISVRIVPNPVTAGTTSFVYVDAEVSEVEVLNSFGQVVDTFVPDSRPIEVTGISASGIYYVRLLLTNGNVAVEKLIVK